MPKPYYDTPIPRCQEINHQVKLAEQHQQVYYRDTLIQPAKKGQPILSAVYKPILALAAALRAAITSRPSQYIGGPAQNSRTG